MFAFADVSVIFGLLYHGVLAGFKITSVIFFCVILNVNDYFGMNVLVCKSKMNC